MRLSTACRMAMIFAFAAVLSSAASARGFGYRNNYEDGQIVTAYSRFGNGSISGPVRPARFGWQVRLPHGTWVSCRRSCEETLRVETVDIFENQGRLAGYGTVENECGIFGCLDITYPR